MLTQLQNTPSDLGLSLQATPTLVRSGQAVRVIGSSEGSVE